MWSFIGLADTCDRNVYVWLQRFDSLRVVATDIILKDTDDRKYFWTRLIYLLTLNPSDFQVNSNLTYDHKLSKRTSHFRSHQRTVFDIPTNV